MEKVDLSIDNVRKSIKTGLKIRQQKLLFKIMVDSEQLLNLSRRLRNKNSVKDGVCKMWRKHLRLSLIATKKKLQAVKDRIEGLGDIK